MLYSTLKPFSVQTATSMFIISCLLFMNIAGVFQHLAYGGSQIKCWCNPGLPWPGLFKHSQECTPRKPSGSFVFLSTSLDYLVNNFDCELS